MSITAFWILTLLWYHGFRSPSPGDIVATSAVTSHNCLPDAVDVIPLPPSALQPGMDEQKPSLDREEAGNFTKIDTVLTSQDSLTVFLNFLYGDRKDKEYSIDFLATNWNDSHVPLLIDILYLIPDEWLIAEISGLLEKHTGEAYGTDYFNWLQWLWRQDPVYQENYNDFKAELYRPIDQRFEIYFRNRHHLARIRLDEVVWGGVPQDGIPPLRNPDMIESRQADYLSDSDIVFGVYINGDARAYPKRILAWHEFFTDQIGGVDIAGVYCTLCGTVIAYDPDFEGVKHALGTSGFLYRSNKLMYDQATQSLWSTISGRPVIGPLIDQNISLKSYPVVTTTWEEWKKRHPQTLVLSQNTGYERDYGEGAAYREYFASDQLMFPVPRLDSRLKNKDEVLIIRVPGYEKDPLAISTDYLKKRRIHQGQIAQTPFVVLTEKNGASRVFHRVNNDFRSYRNGILLDRSGNEWKVSEDQLMDTQGNTLLRLPSHQIYWFAWFNTYPQTRLTK